MDGTFQSSPLKTVNGNCWQERRKDCCKHVPAESLGKMWCDGWKLLEKEALDWAGYSKKRVFPNICGATRATTSLTADGGCVAHGAAQETGSSGRFGASGRCSTAAHQRWCSMRPSKWGVLSQLLLSELTGSAVLQVRLKCRLSALSALTEMLAAPCSDEARHVGACEGGHH